MWMFLTTEVLFFGGLFAAYTIYRYKFEKVFEQASNILDPLLGGINTIVLIFSSVTMAFAVRSAQQGKSKAIVAWLAATIVFGSMFLGIKYFEWKHDATLHVFPTADFNWTWAREKHAEHEHHESHEPEMRGLVFNSPKVPQSYIDKDSKNPEAKQARLFFFLYFMMTSLHAAHMVIGFGIMAVIMIYAWNGFYTANYYVPVESVGLYWHFVDLVWIFLYPLLYLLGAHLSAGH
jgi:cytochrome c oxidase subunit 3